MSYEIIALLISLLSCVIAFVSACYARKSRDIAKKANRISIHHDLKPARLAVYNRLRDFADYCGKYYTLQHVKVVEGTNDLCNRIAELKWEIDSYGPLDMKDIEVKAEEFQKKAWQLQRVLDRLNGKDRSSLDKEYENIKDNLYGLIDWFAKERNDLKQLVEKYLNIA
jgi:hypothetical protein